MTVHQQYERTIGRARFLLAGDTGVVVEFGDRVDRELSEAVLQLRSILMAAKLPGVLDLVPSFRSLLVQYDPLVSDGLTIIDAIVVHMDTPVELDTQPRTWELPACYDETLAPDVTDVADRLNMSVSQIIDLHSAQDYSVYFLGFLPGCALIGDLPSELELPRRTTPRVRVPEGSLAIAMRLSIVYPLVSPGGWHLIGNCPLQFFDHRATPPSLLAPGDKVRFKPISLSEHAALSQERSTGRLFAESERFLRA
ncbi:5-oxoprolinase subunit PxpB [Ensifer adhaerens]|uniref:5-oxoprolinase subunit PxpB n=1 Tax=Ensifer adhaerens TaxID=106592 RepID=UPI001CBEDAD1|nr:5-oxoprolinase subunit PxpB [Ensifer adhaerens]MBZ7924336.1 5-oxoprolinase subunit PxpB [Ensifer adhaerens]UAX96415.1 5-oxoprolinase subunit PxpB [Ensifer adhaerens]UAY04242.1 5-oxoprolinase subunit PxpB [Ensifer adhaerens]UAY12228.1 5-oxoprolinase subunit PxpB [Ensifer adhaerens]